MEAVSNRNSCRFCRQDRENYDRAFMFTGFSKNNDYLVELVQQLTTLGKSTFFGTEYFNVKSTHLICTKPCRTEKFLGALATGKWILTASYIEDSYKAKCWLPEEDYEISRKLCTSIDVNIPVSMYDAPRKCRLHVEKTGLMYFNNWQVGVLVQCRKKKSGYERLLKCGGATVIPFNTHLFDMEKVCAVTHVFIDNNIKWNRITPFLIRNIPCIYVDYIRAYLFEETPPPLNAFYFSSKKQPENQNFKYGGIDFSPVKSFSMQLQPVAYRIPDSIANNKRACNEYDESKLKRLKVSKATKVQSGPMDKFVTKRESTPNSLGSNLLQASLVDNKNIIKNTQNSNSHSNKLLTNNRKPDLNSLLESTRASSIDISECVLYDNWVNNFIFDKCLEDEHKQFKHLSSKISSSKRNREIENNISISKNSDLSSVPNEIKDSTITDSELPISNGHEIDDGTQLSDYDNSYLITPNGVCYRGVKLKELRVTLERIDVSKYVMPKPQTRKMKISSQHLKRAVSRIIEDGNKTDITKTTWRPQFHLCCSRSMKNLSTNAEVLSSELSDYINDLFESSVDSKVIDIGLSIISSSVSSTRYPPSQILSKILTLVKEGGDFVDQACKILFQVTELHPPCSVAMQDYYIRALCCHSTSENFDCAQAWCFISSLMRFSIDEGMTKLLLKWIVILLEMDFYNFLSNKNVNRLLKNRYKIPLICRLIWVDCDVGYLNRSCRELLTCFVQASSLGFETKEKVEFFMNICSILSMVAECCRLVSSSKQLFIGVNPLENLGDKALQISHQLASQIKESDMTYENLKNLLNVIEPSWFAAKVSLLLLDHYSESVVNFANEDMLSKVLKFYIPLIFSKQRNDGNCKWKQHSQIISKKNGTFKAESKSEGINVKNKKGETKLHRACIKNDLNAIKELLKVPGINVNAQDNFGWTPLHEACLRGNVEVVEVLLKFKPQNSIYNYFATENGEVDVTLCSQDGVTALHDAVSSNFVKIVKLLLERGGTKLLHIKNSKNETPLECAYSEEVISCLNSYSNSNSVLLSSEENNSQPKNQEDLELDDNESLIISNPNTPMKKMLLPQNRKGNCEWNMVKSSFTHKMLLLILKNFLVAYCDSKNIKKLWDNLWDSHNNKLQVQSCHEVEGRILYDSIADVQAMYRLGRCMNINHHSIEDPESVESIEMIRHTCLYKKA